MTDRIDLGEELRDFRESRDGVRSDLVAYDEAYCIADEVLAKHVNSSPRNIGSLSDLKDQGFNTTPPWPGFDPKNPKPQPDNHWQCLSKILTWPNPILPTTGLSILQRGSDDDILADLRARNLAASMAITYSSPLTNLPQKLITLFPNQTKDDQ